MTRGAARSTALAGVLALLLFAPGGFGGAIAHAAPPFWPGIPAPPGWPGGPGLPPWWPSEPPGVPGTPPATPPAAPPAGPGAGSPPRPKPPAVVPCRIRTGSRADFVFTAVLIQGGRRDRGRDFEFGAVQDLLIEVRWLNLDVSARQRLELYGPDGHLFQMFTTTLPAQPDPVEVRVPVNGSWIAAATLVGTWCAKVYLDDELTPAAADDFELRFPRER